MTTTIEPQIQTEAQADDDILARMEAADVLTGRLRAARQAGFGRRHLAELAGVAELYIWRVDRGAQVDDPELGQIVAVFDAVETGKLEPPRRAVAAGGASRATRQGLLDRLEAAALQARRVLDEQREKGRVRISVINELIATLEN